MSDQGTVSTSDTPQNRDNVSVVTEENTGDIPQDPSHAAPVNPGKQLEDKGASQTSDSGTTDNSKSGDDEQKGKPSNSSRREQRRSRALAKKLEAAEATNQQLTTQLTETNSRIDALESKLNAAPTAAKPKLADYDDEDKFFADMQSWNESQAPAATPKPSTPAPSTPAPKAGDGDDPLQEDRDRLFTDGKEKFGDEFDEVMTNQADPVPISAHMAEFIFDSEVGADLVMWADENREEAQRIYRLGPVRAAKELDKIQAQLIEAGATPAKPHEEGTVETGEQRGLPPEQRQVSQAKPPPGDGVNTGTPAVANGITEGMDMDSYAATRRAQENRNSGRFR